LEYEGMPVVDKFKELSGQLKDLYRQNTFDLKTIHVEFFKAFGQKNIWAGVCDKDRTPLVETTVVKQLKNDDYCKALERKLADSWADYAKWCGADYMIRRAAAFQMLDENVDSLIGPGEFFPKSDKAEAMIGKSLPQWKAKRSRSPRFTIRQQEEVPASSIARRALQIKFLLSFGLHRAF